MSLMNRLVCLHFKLKKRYTAEEFEDVIKNIKEPKIPPKPKKIEYSFKDNVFYFNEKTNSSITIFYIHGGAYVNSFDKHHFIFLRKIIKKTDAYVIAPNYDLIPFSSAQNIIEDLFIIYTNYIKNNPNKKMILMGDSAGGGLSLSLYMHLYKNDIITPDKMILLSPCTDLNMTNPKIEEYKKYDPWLYMDRLKVCVKYFAGNLDYNDYRCSPFFGDKECIHNTLIFVGTKEILNPDITQFFDSLPDKETNKIIIKKNMLHVYPILPIREAKEARNIIANYIIN